MKTLRNILLAGVLGLATIMPLPALEIFPGLNVTGSEEQGYIPAIVSNGEKRENEFFDKTEIKLELNLTNNLSLTSTLGQKCLSKNDADINFPFYFTPFRQDYISGYSADLRFDKTKLSAYSFHECDHFVDKDSFWINDGTNYFWVGEWEVQKYGVKLNQEISMFNLGLDLAYIPDAIVGSAEKSEIRQRDKFMIGANFDAKYPITKNLEIGLKASDNYFFFNPSNLNEFEARLSLFFKFFKNLDFELFGNYYNYNVLTNYPTNFEGKDYVLGKSEYFEIGLGVKVK